MSVNGVCDADAELVRDEPVCPACETASLQRRHCKTVCDRCGYVESCEDNFVPNEEHPIERGETTEA